MTDNHKADMLRKIRALMAKAEGTDHPEEAAAFRRKADELMTAYAIMEWELEQARPPVERLPHHPVRRWRARTDRRRHPRAAPHDPPLRVGQARAARVGQRRRADHREGGTPVRTRICIDFPSEAAAVEWMEAARGSGALPGMADAYMADALDHMRPAATPRRTYVGRNLPTHVTMNLVVAAVEEFFEAIRNNEEVAL